MKITEKEMRIAKFFIGILSLVMGVIWLHDTYLLPEAFRNFSFPRLGYSVARTNNLVLQNIYSCSIGAMLIYAGIAGIAASRSNGATLCAGIQLLFIPFQVICTMQIEETAKAIQDASFSSLNSMMVPTAAIFGIAMILFYIKGRRIIKGKQVKVREEALPVEMAE